MGEEINVIMVPSKKGDLDDAFQAQIFHSNEEGDRKNTGLCWSAENGQSRKFLI